MLIQLLLPLLLCPGRGEEAATFTVEENSPVGTLVGTLRRAGALTYTVTSGSEFFRVEDGDIRVASSPDRELKSEHEMSVLIIFETGSSTQTEMVTVRILVLDVNDNSPSFPRKIINMDISESQPVGFKFSLEPAEDIDAGNNTTQSYRITSSDSPFRLHQRKLGFDNQYSCELELIRHLDREVRESFTIEIVAADGGNPARTDTLTLNIKVRDVNDNVPIFERDIYTPSISEAAPVGSEVVRVRASDGDAGPNSRLSYLLEPRFNREGLFGIDPETGVIRLTGELDRESAATHHLLVRATDSGQYPEKSTVRVTVTVTDVNDNNPTIQVTFRAQEKGQGLVSEANKPGDYVAHISVEDRDSGPNGEVELTMHSEGAPFELVRTAGSGYSVQVAGSLDREEQDLWNLWLEAADRGEERRVTYRNMTVRLLDSNDNTPTFEHSLYRCNVSEIADKGTDIVRVSATDRDIGVNAQIRYYLVSIVTQTSDRTSAISFTINSATGVVTSGSSLDRESHSQVNLTIEARDAGTPSLSSRTLVVVDILDYNDNDPVFSKRHYTSVVEEGAAVGSSVLNVSAVDLDSTGTLRYSIKEYYSAARSVFSINRLTGEILTVSELDYEIQKSYNLVVEAVDNGGRRGVASVEIILKDRNDNAPKFSQLVYRATLLHTVLPGTPVTRVSAFDLDSGVNSQVEYSVVQGGDLFGVDRNTGLLTTSRSLTGMMNETRQVKVQALDGGVPRLSGICTVTVLVGSLNTIHLKPAFSSQEYKVEVPETVRPGRALLTVLASSQDETYRGALSYTLSQLTRRTAQFFNITSDTGIITLQKPLDREVEEVHTIVVEATDELGRQGLASVLVRVTDVNDNLPFFPATAFHFSVREGAGGRTVANLTATDLDTGVHGIVEYGLHSTTPVPFSLDPHTGQLTVKGTLDFEERAQYRMKVRAFNRVNPSQHQEAALVISVIDTNDNAPLFLQHSFSFDLLDSTLAGASVGVALARDADSGRNGQVYYTLQPTKHSELFQVDLQTGQVRTAVDLPGRVDLLPAYSLVVLARDRGSPSRNSTARVEVRVRSTGDVVDQLEQVLQNESISRRARYLIIFFAVAFLSTALVLVCFISYQRRQKSRYKRVISDFKSSKFAPASLRSGGDARSLHLSSETVNSRLSSKLAAAGGHYKYLECGSYCPSIPEQLTEEILSASFFTTDHASSKAISKESLSNFAKELKCADLAAGADQGKYSVAESRLCFPPQASENNRLPETLFGGPTPEQLREARDHREDCSNESGVHSVSATPPSSDTALLRPRENGSPSWVSSDDSLFRKPQGEHHRGASKSLDAKRQVRFQQCHDSFV